MIKNNRDNREVWLQDAATILASRFTKAGYEVPQVRVSCGWPSGIRKMGEGKTIGQCWFGEAAQDGVCQLFISPVLDDLVKVVATLAHEIVHAVVGPDAKHGPKFKKCAKAIGLTGKMTATYADEDFDLWIRTEVGTLIGDYPHAKINPAIGGPKKQPTRLIKVQCGECGYVARTTKQWLETVGTPICPCNNEPMEVAA